jgi:GxxExxY protein
MAQRVLLHGDLTESINGGFFKVYHTLGYGFLEPAYRNALAVELGKRGLKVRREVPVELIYEGVSVGTYRIDLLVEDKIIVEVKTQIALSAADEKQLFNYLRVAPIEVGLLFNFGPEPKLQRMILTNDRKQSVSVSVSSVSSV